MTSKKILLVLCLSIYLGNTPTFTQTADFVWAQRAGGNHSFGFDRGYSVTCDNQGNCVVTGYFTGTADFGSFSLSSIGQNDNDIFIAKYNTDGTVLWAKRAGGKWDDFGQSVTCDNHGNYIVTGRFGDTADFGPFSLTANGGSDVFIAKYSPNGTVLWAKRAGGINNNNIPMNDIGYSVACDNQDNYIVTGYFVGTADFGSFSLTSKDYSDIFVAKYNSNGTVLWAKRAGSINFDQGNAVVCDNQGNYVVTGMFQGTVNFGPYSLTSNGYVYDIFVVKYHANGTVLWAERAGSSSGHDEGYSVACDDQGNYIVTGRFGGTADFGPHSLTSSGTNDIFVAKYSPNGTVLWAERAGSSGSYDEGYSVTSDKQGNYIVTGRFGGTADFGPYSLTCNGSNYDIFITKYNPNGTVLWAKRAGAGGYAADAGNSVVCDNQGNYIITGEFEGTAEFGPFSLACYGPSDIFITKLAEYTPSNVIIDAQKDNFYNQLTGPENGLLHIPAAVSNDNGEASDDIDLSATLWSCWDTNYLYIYQEVTDNIVNVNHPTDPWLNDCLEIKIDPDPSAKATNGVVSARLTALGIFDAQGGQWDNLGPEQNYPGAQPGDFARRKTANGYVLECRLKWSDMVIPGRLKIMPRFGSVFGLAYMNHDNDTNTRDASIEWAAELKDAVWTNPQMLGTVKFLASNKLQYTAANAIDASVVNPLAELYESTPLPVPWLTLDIGDAKSLAGEADYKNNTFIIKAAGSDIWAQHDGFRHTFQTLSGDVGITAKVTSIYDIEPWTKAGLMIRDALTDDAAHASINMTGANGDEFLWRPVAGGASKTIHQPFDTLETPYWVKLIRLSDIFYGYSSADGQNWELVGTTDIKMKDPVFVGLAVTSHLVDFRTTATFSDVIIDKNPKLPQTGISISIDGNRDKWYDNLTGPENGLLAISAAHYNDNGQPDDYKDLSATLWTAWDQSYLYFYEEVNDDVVVLNRPESWQNDVLEFYFDPEPEAKTASGQIGITMTALGDADVTNPTNLAGVTNLTANGMATGNSVDAADYARKKSNDGYILEGRIKWDWIKATDGRKSITPQIGETFGAAVMNHDNDGNGREGSITWAAVMEDAVWNDPSLHGTVEFLPDNQLKFTAQNSINTTLRNPIESLYNPNELPEGWLTMNIGPVGKEGSTTENNGTWYVTGSGDDIWNASDAFRFAFQVQKGNIEITARLSNLTKSHDWTKAGLMIRDELTTDSKHVFMAIASENGQSFQYRTTKSGASNLIPGNPNAVPPQWLKLTRIKDALSGWVSNDGISWQQIGQMAIVMDDQIYVGLAITAHDNTLLSTATFENVKLKIKDITNVENLFSAEKPTEFDLAQNYPNPFNPVTTISYTLPEPGHTTLSIYNMNGQLVRTLADEEQNTGAYSKTWDAADDAGAKVGSGVYLYRIQIFAEQGREAFCAERKMVLLK
ncbi:T9SS type A sorting domain-containing protein [candidate division KSB1 bacterium]|nr:T9SS type A sorting domain-containing protein [candidate division KSB1 bacterium]